MESNHSVLNNYLVDFFNSILKIEENSLNAICNELSLREMHTIEAILNSPDGGVGSVAAKLKITMGTLSVALKTLESKGYILRERTRSDRRQVKVRVTGKGLEVNRRHQNFHHRFVDELISCLSEAELDVLMKGLEKLNEHFYSIERLKLINMKDDDMKIKLTIDSACDLTEELLKRYDVGGIVPLTIIFGDESRVDGTFDPSEIYAFHKRTNQIPTTSAINPAEFEDFFREQTADGSAVVHFSVSGEMSASCANAMIAAREFENVYVVDGRQVSAGTALLLFHARDILESNPETSARDLAELIRGMTNKVRTGYCLETLEYLHKNGRCGALGALGASLLELHPSIQVKDGINTLGRKYRGKLRAVIPQYIRDVRKDNPDYDDARCFIVHSAGTDPDIIDSAVSLTKELFSFKEIFVTAAGSTITCHCGKGTLGIAFMSK